MATLSMYTSIFDGYEAIGLLNIKPQVSAPAMYAGPIEQEIAESMQADMDGLIQTDFFGNPLSAPSIPSKADRCIEFRKNYFNDMQANAEEFERFEDNFSFSKGYTSEDPIESFNLPPSVKALEAFLQF